MDKPFILLIEDDPFLVEIYSRKFSESGFELEVAYDGQEGMAKLKERKPDLLILDIILPKLDGFEILRQIKNDPDLADLPVLLLTNLGAEEDIKRAKEFGVDTYIIKAQFTPLGVVKKVKQMLSAK